MSNLFAIHNGTSLVAPPAEARPDTTLPPIVRYPQVFTDTGNDPVAVSKPFAIVGRAAITQVGLDWYLGFIGTAPSVAITVRLLDPISGVWETYTGVMMAPMFDRNFIGGKFYPDFQVTFGNLEKA